MATIKKTKAKKAAPKKPVLQDAEWPRDTAINAVRRLGELEAEFTKMKNEIVTINQATSLLLSAFVGIKGLTESQVRRIMPEQYRVLRELEQPKYRVVRESEKRDDEE